MQDKEAWPNPSRLHDHGGWRPDWTGGRTRLWWYLTFEDQPALRSLSDGVQRHLESVAVVDVVPPQWLHLTVQDIGFVDDVDQTDVDDVTAAAAEAVDDHPPLRLTVGPVTTLREAVVLAAGPTEPLRTLRSRLGEAGASNGCADACDGPSPFWPHISLGYVNRECDRDAVLDGIGPVASKTTEVTVPRLTLAAVTRKPRHYEWSARTEIPLGVTVQRGWRAPRSRGGVGRLQRW